MRFMLADETTIPPTPSSYWVVPSRLLAGAYPGHLDPAEHETRIHTLVDAGILTFVNLMEADEANSNGQQFVPYEDTAAQRSPEAAMRRHAIRDLSIPTHATMNEILDAIDGSLASDSPVYVHCWGGIGRTGTVIGCWLLRHGLANPDDVLDVLQDLRQRDQERHDRESPETGQQRKFVRQWLTHRPGA
ncbi:protein-tyrosine phosphatase family protein [Bremerella sp. P1]|uniref:protein-tyrosine phosphatase family protein n=1 Tax=Bremerella sp. P1 TaxID=3026424 RepID=UPI0023686944|nr:protein-tyrosine phosphatase family protein [Bremerella sp. P1]WDI41875.1 protein-tyrosine phosphatase family protein [Bremerella sp. P1]